MIPTEATVPFTPPVSTESLPGCGGRLGPEPEDFRVQELPAYLPSGKGEHWMVEVRKRLLTTPDLVRMLARSAGVRERDVGVAGMKDRFAVTTQWLTFPSNARPPESWQLPEGVELVQISRHDNKLRTGHQRGNLFTVKLVDLDAGAYERASAILEQISRHGLPNYFGAQRFGRGGSNLARAQSWLRSGSRGRHRTQDKLMPSVLQSEVFNRYLARRQALGLERLLQGEVVRLGTSTRHFIVEDAEVEQPRLTSGELHLTGPLPGPKCLAARGTPAELEVATLAELGLDEATLAPLADSAPGTRRDLLVHPESLSVQQVAEGHLLLNFALPSGSFATQLLRELTRSPWLERHGSEAGRADGPSSAGQPSAEP